MENINQVVRTHQWKNHTIGDIVLGTQNTDFGVYAPTDDRLEQEKEQFVKKLHEQMEK